MLEQCLPGVYELVLGALEYTLNDIAEKKGKDRGFETRDFMHVYAVSKIL